MQLSIADTPHKPQLRPYRSGACCAWREVDVQFHPSHAHSISRLVFGCCDTPWTCLYSCINARHNERVVASFHTRLPSLHRYAMEENSITFRSAVQLIWWPLSKCVFVLRLVLAPILRLIPVLLSPVWAIGSVLVFLCLPFIHLVKGLFNVITSPLQVEWLERIEVRSPWIEEEADNNNKSFRLCTSTWAPPV